MTTAVICVSSSPDNLRGSTAWPRVQLCTVTACSARIYGQYDIKDCSLIMTGTVIVEFEPMLQGVHADATRLIRLKPKLFSILKISIEGRRSSPKISQTSVVTAISRCPCIDHAMPRLCVAFAVLGEADHAVAYLPAALATCTSLLNGMYIDRRDVVMCCTTGP